MSSEVREMYLIPKETFMNCMSVVNEHQRNRINDVNVDQLNVSCGPLFAGLKTRDFSREEEKMQIGHENENFDEGRNLFDEEDWQLPDKKDPRSISSLKENDLAKNNARTALPKSASTQQRKKVIPMQDGNQAVKNKSSAQTKSFIPTKYLKVGKTSQPESNFSFTEKNIASKSVIPGRNSKENSRVQNISRAKRKSGNELSFAATSGSDVINYPKAKAVIDPQTGKIQSTVNFGKKGATDVSHQSADQTIMNRILGEKSFAPKDLEPEKSFASSFARGLKASQQSHPKIRLNSTLLRSDEEEEGEADSVFREEQETRRMDSISAEDSVLQSLQKRTPEKESHEHIFSPRTLKEKGTSEEEVNKKISDMLRSNENSQEQEEITRSAAKSRIPRPVSSIASAFDSSAFYGKRKGSGKKQARTRSETAKAAHEAQKEKNRQGINVPISDSPKRFRYTHQL